MQSYSQHGQDIFVHEWYFKDRTTPGVFVDVGAYDGVKFSNTLLFEQLGWHGICIEPLPSAYEKLKTVRKAISLNCAVSDLAGTATFLEIDMPSGFEKMYSGLKDNFDARHLETIAQWSKTSKEVTVPVRRLDDVLAENNIRHVDYMSVDTEGSEWKILQSLDLRAYDVKVLSIENNYQNKTIRRHMADHGYGLIHVFADFDELYVRLY